MANRNTSITINGKRYEAQVASIGDGRPQSIDGLVRGRPAVVTAQDAIQPVTIAPAAKPLPDVSRPKAANAVARAVKPSTTLMRQAVQKPSHASLKRHTKVHGSTLALATNPTSIKPKTAVHAVNESRVARAKSATTSPRIAKFTGSPSAVVPSIPVIAPAIYRPEVSAVSKPAVAKPDVFEQALAKAVSHEQTTPNIKTRRHKKNRVLAFAASGTAVVVIAGFTSIQLLGGLQLKMASNKAGFSVTLPSYKPAGFNAGKLQTANGYFGTTFTSDEASFGLTEKPSNWNSATLLSNIVGNNQSFNTIETAGRTVYLYGKDQAAWVNNGILYNISNHSSLSQQQLANIAASM